jgi:hypothetical protein
MGKRIGEDHERILSGPQDGFAPAVAHPLLEDREFALEHECVRASVHDADVFATHLHPRRGQAVLEPGREFQGHLDLALLAPHDP